MKILLHLVFEEGRTLSFTDYICDDGVGYGPYELKLSLTRTGDKVHLDFTGSSPQAQGPINYYINENLVRMFFGIYMITVADPQILWNDGFYPLVDVTIPDGSFWKPRHPAALNARNHGIGRVFDLFGGLLGQTNPALLNAAGFSSSPHFMYSGNYSTGDRKGEWFQLYSIGFGGIPGPAAGRRPGRAFAVAELRQHPVRIPGVVLPAADREVGDRHRHRRFGAAPRRQRRRRRLPIPGARHHRHPRRPLADLPVGRQRRRARRPRHASGSTGRTAAHEVLPSKCHDVPVVARATCCTSSPGAAAAGATRWSATRSWSRWRSGAAWSAPSGARRYGVVVDDDGGSTRRAPTRCGRDAGGPGRRAAGLRHGPGAGGAAGTLRGGDRPAGAQGPGLDVTAHVTGPHGAAFGGPARLGCSARRCSWST